ncbi:30S ribosomal subunit protein S3 [Candidatus Nasuia deltocephalinicola]|uniref:Small ribosomal subunit protein uS3 n=1 Tax=Candidatus Nasuia deltocephalincola TaxID=1160784 RepID=A0A974WR56_9PROT|nr:30S ribosomal protein S3 [Candidatus Nasuia deltocephalinicola]BEH03944.1 30S ribosomal subunit protein S3 [Candidatus Nasuia deltocephalinicola]
MSKKVNPYLFRLNLNRNWNSFWYSKKSCYSEYLLEDFYIRNYLEKYFKKKPLGKIMIFKNINYIFIIIYLKKIPNINKLNFSNLKKELSIFTDKSLYLNFKNISVPDLDVKIIFFYIKKKIESRKSYKGILKNIISKIFKLKCLGLKIIINGRINGNIMTRKQIFFYGKIPLQKICSNIRYYSGTAQTFYGSIGIKIWIYLGDFIY